MNRVSDEQIRLFEQNLQIFLYVFLKSATLGDDGKVTNEITKTGDGAVTYSSSDTNVATVALDNECVDDDDSTYEDLKRLTGQILGIVSKQLG